MWSNIAYGTTLDAQAHTVVEAAYRPNHSHQYSITAYGRKDIDWQTLQCELSATGGRGEREMLLQSSLLTYHTTSYVLRVRSVLTSSMAVVWTTMPHGNIIVRRLLSTPSLLVI